MPKRLLKRSKFAELCGVAPASVTQAARGCLAGAVDGPYIDANHPDALAYIRKHTEPQPESPATGIDPLYEKAIDFCSESGRWTASAISRGIGTGYVRASRIFESMKAAGVVPDKHVEKPVPPPKLPPRPKPTGNGAVKEAKKRQPPLPTDGLVEIPEDIQTFADMTLRELIERFGTDVRFIDWLNAIQKIEMINERRLKNGEAEGRLVSRALVKSAIIDRIDGVFVRMLTDGAKTIAARAHAMALADSPLAEVRAMVEDQLGSFIRPAKVKMSEALRDEAH